MRALLTAAALALLVAAPSAQEEEWRVPDHTKDTLLFVQEYWAKLTDGEVKVAVEDPDGTIAAPAAVDGDRLVKTNASFSPADSTINAGGTVGVVLLPLDRGGARTPSLKITTKEVVTYMAIGVAIGAVIGLVLARMFPILLGSVPTPPDP